MSFKTRITNYVVTVVSRITSKTATRSISPNDTGDSISDLSAIVQEVVVKNAGSRFYNANFGGLYRDYISEQEVIDNVASDEIGSGNVYYVNTGGTIDSGTGVLTGGTRAEWWFVDGDLVPKATGGANFINGGTVYIPGNPLGNNGEVYAPGDSIVSFIEAWAFQTLGVTVNANNPSAITLPTATVTLVGHAVKGSATIGANAWTLVSKPSGAPDPVLGTPSIVTDGSGNVTNTVVVTNMTTAGNYVFRYTATDGAVTPSVNVTALVNAQVIVPPTIDAIAPISTHLSNSVSSQTITAVAHQGTNAITFNWTQISGPTTGISIVNGTTTAATITGLDVAGTADYVFRCTVTDGITTVHSDATLHAIVDPATIVTTPQTIQLPTTTGTLTATVTAGSYPIASQAWSFISGPVTATVDASTGAVTGMTAVGAYVFRKTVTDTKGNIYTANETMTQTAAVIRFYYDFFTTDPTNGDTADVTTLTFANSVVVTDQGAWTIPDAHLGDGKWFGGKIISTQPDRTHWNNDNGLNQGPIPDAAYKATQTFSGNKYQFSQDVININPGVPQLSFT